MDMTNSHGNKVDTSRWLRHAYLIDFLKNLLSYSTSFIIEIIKYLLKFIITLILSNL